MFRTTLALYVSTLLCPLARSTDRVVSPSGTYNTISCAIAASSDGDRVLVSAGTYNEYVNILRSISILPLEEGGRYNVLKDVRLVDANGAIVTIAGMRANELKILGTYSARTELRILDSRFSTCNAVNPYFHTELYRDTILSPVSISSGAVVGNTILASTIGGVTISGATTLPDVVHVVGNFIQVTNWPRIVVNNDRTVHIQNNFLYGQPDNVGCILFNRAGDANGPGSTVVNNTLYYTSYMAGAPGISIIGTAAHTLTIKNNTFINFATAVQLGTTSVAATQSNNVLAAPSWVDPATGRSLLGSPLIDAGDPDPRYFDLDLTTNDVGCYGGSNSRANFTTPMGSAVVGFMNAPRVVAQGETVNISATGFDR